MSKYILYQHAGSGNHGCEALVRTVIQTIKNIDSEAKFSLISSKSYEDYKYGIDKIKDLEIVDFNKSVKKGNLNWFYLQLGKIIHQKDMQLRAIFNLNWTKEEATFIAIGGDNYCYNKGRAFYDIDRYISGRKILWGCSIEPSDLDTELVSHLKEFNVITARETITFEALQKHGIKNVYLVPDTAFTLNSQKKCLKGSYFGINISPLIMNYSLNSNLIYDNYRVLIQEILNSTSDKILFIPHVITDGNDDRISISRLINELKIPQERYFIVEDCNCMELKGYIQCCRFFVGARTHATIAAYSSGIPTLVVGYSVKSKGIAIDIYGQYQGFVVSVNELSNKFEITSAYKKLIKNYDMERKQNEYTDKANKLIHEVYSNIL